MLCRSIENGVGPRNFLSEIFIVNEMSHNPMYRAHEDTTGGFICGEIKVAVTLRLLAGGSYLDIAHIFGVSYSTTYEIFHTVTKDWFCRDWISSYTLEKNLDDPRELYETAKKFTARGRR